jgi:zona occludens toxin
VVEIILPALAAGRRVVTNIEGLKDDAIYQRLEIDWKIPADKIGEIVHVTDDDILSDEFYYCPPEDFAKLKLRSSEDYESIVQPGDLVVIDEAWLFYESKVSPIVMNFFRKHRHFVNENNVACDVVLITQDVMDIGLKVRRIIKSTTVTTKMNAVGLDSCYNVKIFSKFDLRSVPTFEGKGIYRKENFELYDSYSFKSEKDKKGRRTGIEKKVDKRGNLWANKSIRYGLPTAIIVIGIFIYKFSMFFSKEGSLRFQSSQPSSAIAPAPPVTPQSRSPFQVSSSSFSTTNSQNNKEGATNNGQGAPVVEPSEPKESHTVGVQGYYQVGEKLFVLLRVDDKNRVLVEPKDFKIKDAIRIEGTFQNEIVNTYTGKAISLKEKSSQIGVVADKQKSETSQKALSSIN